MKICLDVGHSCRDGGAWNKSFNMNEYEYWNGQRVVNIAKKLEIAGHKVTIVNRFKQGAGTGPAAAARACNGAMADIIISLHGNASDYADVSGSLVLYYYKSTKGKLLAEILHKHQLKALGLRDHGCRAISKSGQRGYVQLAQTRAVCVILEPFFIDHTPDLEQAINKSEALENAIVTAVNEYANAIK